MKGARPTAALGSEGKCWVAPGQGEVPTPPTWCIPSDVFAGAVCPVRLVTDLRFKRLR